MKNIANSNKNTNYATWKDLVIANLPKDAPETSELAYTHYYELGHTITSCVEDIMYRENWRTRNSISRKIVWEGPIGFA